MAGTGRGGGGRNDVIAAGTRFNPDNGKAGKVCVRSSYKEKRTGMGGLLSLLVDLDVISFRQAMHAYASMQRSMYSG